MRFEQHSRLPSISSQVRSASSVTRQTIWQLVSLFVMEIICRRAGPAMLTDSVANSPQCWTLNQRSGIATVSDWPCSDRFNLIQAIPGSADDRERTTV